MLSPNCFFCVEINQIADENFCFLEVKSGTDGAVVTFSNFSDEGEQRRLDGRIDLGFLKEDWCLAAALVTNAMLGGARLGLSTMVDGGGVGESEDAGSYKLQSYKASRTKEIGYLRRHCSSMRLRGVAIKNSIVESVSDKEDKITEVTSSPSGGGLPELPILSHGGRYPA
ncbi:hypothetical protein L2E82_34810 [Cichorium intybus]|uniref:Uncharacterized protein n=1 Tax=Cichorium intybus TaxID=13427 RepID=A0ACB9BMT0_CICIN|nr:hypothetical protein L2E82_34810 [Cichorium intybus]